MPSGSYQPQDVLQLQRTHGNAYVRRKLEANGNTVQRGIGEFLGDVAAGLGNVVDDVAEGLGVEVDPPDARWRQEDRRMISIAVMRGGIIDEYQAGRVEPAVDALSPDDYQTFRGLLDQAERLTEKAYLAKALAARRTMAEISTFAGRIRGQSEDWMFERLTVTGIRNWLENGEGITQQFGNSCGPTSVQVVHAEYDPIYALSLHDGGDVHAAVDDAVTNPANRPNATTATEQQNMLIGPNRNPATDRSNPAGGAWVESDLNNLSGSTGITYTTQMVGTGISLDDAITTLTTNAERGVHTPIVVGSAPGATSHYVTVLLRTMGRFQIHDPWTGETVWRTEEQFRENQLNLPSGHTHFVAIDVPNAAATPERRSGWFPGM
jgi:hypothetical protein